MKNFIKTISCSVAFGIIIDIFAYLALSFTYWEWVNMDWILARGVIVLLVGIGVIVFFEEETK